MEKQDIDILRYLVLTYYCAEIQVDRAVDPDHAMVAAVTKIAHL